MRYLQILFLSALASAVLVAPARAFLMSHSVPPASFLNYHVDTVSELTFEVTYDKVVQARLAHHFHLTGPAMCAYVRDSLVLKHLVKPFRTRVYCVSPRGREYFVVMTLKRGSEVFAMRRTGQPILRLVCGNPLVAALPPTPAKKAAAARPPVKAAKPASLAKALTPTAPAPPAVMVAPSIQTASALPIVSTVPGVPSEVVFTAGSLASSGPPAWLVWLPVAGGLIAAFPHGGGSGNPPSLPTGSGTHTTSNTPPTFTTLTPNGPAPQPVPEPSPFWVFAVGALALGAWRVTRTPSGPASRPTSPEAGEAE